MEGTNKIFLEDDKGQPQHFLTQKDKVEKNIPTKKVSTSNYAYSPGYRPSTEQLGNFVGNGNPEEQLKILNKIYRAAKTNENLQTKEYLQQEKYLNGPVSPETKAMLQRRGVNVEKETKEMTEHEAEIMLSELFAEDIQKYLLKNFTREEFHIEGDEESKTGSWIVESTKKEKEKMAQVFSTETILKREGISPAKKFLFGQGDVLVRMENLARKIINRKEHAKKEVTAQNVATLYKEIEVLEKVFATGELSPEAQNLIASRDAVENEEENLLLKKLDVLRTQDPKAKEWEVRKVPALIREIGEQETLIEAREDAREKKLTTIRKALQEKGGQKDTEEALAEVKKLLEKKRGQLARNLSEILKQNRSKDKELARVRAEESLELEKSIEQGEIDDAKVLQEAKKEVNAIYTERLEKARKDIGEFLNQHLNQETVARLEEIYPGIETAWEDPKRAITRNAYLEKILRDGVASRTNIAEKKFLEEEREKNIRILSAEKIPLLQNRTLFANEITALHMSRDAIVALNDHDTLVAFDAEVQKSENVLRVIDEALEEIKSSEKKASSNKE